MENIISVSDLLWRTRGFRWDYTFLLAPIVVPEDSWYRAYRQIMALQLFREGEGGLVEEVLSFRISPDIRFNVSVAAVIDERCDAFGRPIRHTLGLYLPFCGSETQAVPVDWPSTVWATLTPAYAELHCDGTLLEGSQTRAREIIRKELHRTSKSSHIVDALIRSMHLPVRTIEM